MKILLKGLLFSGQDLENLILGLGTHSLSLYWKMVYSFISEYKLQNTLYVFNWYNGFHLVKKWKASHNDLQYWERRNNIVSGKTLKIIFIISQYDPFVRPTTNNTDIPYTLSLKSIKIVASSLKSHKYKNNFIGQHTGRTPSWISPHLIVVQIQHSFCVIFLFLYSP